MGCDNSFRNPPQRNANGTPTTVDVPFFMQRFDEKPAALGLAHTQWTRYSTLAPVM